MKKGYFQKWFLGLAVSALVIGCGSSGSSGGDGGDGGDTPSFKGLASLAGTLGTDKSGYAQLRLDVDGDGRYDSKADITTSVKFEDGAFRFEGIKTLKDKVLNGQLIVTVPGYAPFQKAVTLNAGQSYAVDASGALLKPALKEVVSLKGLSRSARMGSVIEFGIRKEGDQFHSFSRLISLSQFAAEKDFPVADGRVSTYTFATASIPEEVELVDATMQAFDSTKPDDIDNFPGTFRGYGEKGAKSAAGGDEVGLQSAAFDLLVLKDQNGQDIKLVSQDSKLGGTVDLSTCVNKWTRHVTAAQATVINGWGDYDTADPGYQVPIWSNDNSESAWKFVGVANFDATNSRFEMCIPDDWGSGYLNCDSPIAFEKPVTMCVNALDQTGSPVSSVSVRGNSASGEYAYGYTDSNGKVSLGLTNGDIASWSFTYSGSLAGWAQQAVDASDIREVNTTACDYELNLTIISPYIAEVKVTAKEVNGSAAANAYVSLYNNAYAHYMSKSGITDANGTVTFTVEPNVTYTANYRTGEAEVNVDGVVRAPETADSGAYADVDVRDVNQKPEGYIYLTMPVVNKDLMTSMPVETSAWDNNGDSLTRVSLKVDGSAVTLANETPSSSPGSYFSYGDLNITGLSVGMHTIEAVFSDGSLDKTVSATFEVKGNRPPEIGDLLSAYKYNTAPGEFDDSTDVYYIETNGSTIKAAFYNFVANATDPDGDAVTLTMELDGTSYNPEFTPMRDEVVTISDGIHTMQVTAKDEMNATTNKTFVFNAGNQAPVITRVVISPNPVNLHAGHMATLFAYVNDPDGDGIATAVATDVASATEYNLTCNGSGSCQAAIDLSTIGVDDDRVFSVVATDGLGAASNVMQASVVIRDENRNPVFVQSLYDITVPINTKVYFDASAEDPDMTRLVYVWKVDGTAVTPPADDMMNLQWPEEGEHVVTCTATDAEGGSTTTTAHVRVIDPSKEVALTVKTGYPGVVVTAHDAGNSLKMIKSGTTDASGEVTLMLPAGTTTTSFSLAFDPTVVVTSDQVFEDKKDDLLSEAANHCRWDQDLNITQCAGADWCALLADTDSIPTWTVDAAQLKDKSDANITGASVDTNSDDEISKAEFYQMALRMADKDSNGELTWAELDERTVDVVAFVGVPVKTYDFKFKMENHDDNMYGEEGLNCSNYPTFDINVTNASAYVGSVEVYGSGYGYGSANGANAFGVKVTSFMKDSDGKYDYIVKLRDESYNLAAVDLLLDKSAADLSTGKSYDGMSLTPPTTQDVNITNDVPHVWMSVAGTYKGIQGLDDSQGLGNSMFRYFSDSRLHYAISASEYLGTADTEKSYEHKDYYGDGTLKNSYKASDYPMLDIDANLSTGMAKYSGADTGKINVSKVIFTGYTRNDYGYYEDDNYNIEIIRYANQTADFDLDMNISEVFPAGIATVIEDAMDASTEKKVEVKAYEHKNKTAYEVLDMRVAGDYMGIQASPKRLFRYSTMAGGGSAAP